MDSIPVNWEALDALIIDFIKSEKLIEDSSSFPSPSSSPSSSSPSSASLSSSSYHSRLIISQIRKSIETGDIDAAVDLLRSHAPFVLDDHRILFRLQKQKFVELLRRGTAEDIASAVDCSRTSLAPSALDAYPEAYVEFKHILLAFIYDKDDPTSPVAKEWCEKRRLEIAGLMSSVLRAHLHAYDPLFSMTLRYLISIHKGFCFRQGLTSSIADLTERLLFEERDTPAAAQESLFEAPPFNEVDIQALAHAVELTRQGAVDSLRFAKGDLFLAFQNELCRMKFNASMLDELVKEYCVYRGIVESPTASVLARNCSLEVDSNNGKHSDCEASINTSQVKKLPENKTDPTSIPGIDAELRYAGEQTSTCEDCSTSGSHQHEHSRVMLRSRKQVTGERMKRKRWRGRDDEVGYISDITFSGSTKQEPCSIVPNTTTNIPKEQQDVDRPFLSDKYNREDNYEIVLGMKELANKGMAAEVVEELNSMDPTFFVHNPVLLFQLKQVEFLKLVSSGDHSSALKVACSHLGPLAANDESLLKPLKETLLALLQPNEDALRKGLPLSALATSLQDAVGRSLGIKEPQLMKIMRATLHTHTEWFKLQMCKDHFESFLKIDTLKEARSDFLSTAMSKSNADSCTHESSQVTISSNTKMSEDGNSSNQVSSRDGWDENAILKVMEFLALPRSDAIHLLAQYNGNAETVIQQLFA